VRTCALEQIASLDAAQQVLEWEVQRYNRHQRHSTTGELPDQRFAKPLASGNSLFRPFRLPLPYTAPEDVFCLRQTRITDGYRHISLANQDIAVPRALPHQEIDLHLVPDVTRQTMQVRRWQDDQLLVTTSLPLDRFRVHF